MKLNCVTLLGGSGFVGRTLARQLAAAGIEVRAIGRQAEHRAVLPAGVTPWSADVHDADAMHRALSGADAAVYLPGLVQGRNRREFQRIHVDAARACAQAARAQGLPRFIYVSALGARADASALADQTKALGEQAVAGAFPGAGIVRSSLVLGPDDHFSGPMARLMRRVPVLPVIGPGTLVQPLHVDDLAEGLHAMLRRDDTTGLTCDAAGPARHTMLELLDRIRGAASARCRLLALPEWAALGLATITEPLPGRPLCRDQVRLMRTHKVPDGEHPTLTDLGIHTRDPLSALAELVAKAG